MVAYLFQGCDGRKHSTLALYPACPGKGFLKVVENSPVERGLFFVQRTKYLCFYFLRQVRNDVFVCLQPSQYERPGYLFYLLEGTRLPGLYGTHKFPDKP